MTTPQPSEILVIGGGVTGALVTYWLARAGVRVTSGASFSVDISSRKTPKPFFDLSMAAARAGSPSPLLTTFRPDRFTAHPEMAPTIQDESFHETRIALADHATRTPPGRRPDELRRLPLEGRTEDRRPSSVSIGPGGGEDAGWLSG